MKITNNANEEQLKNAQEKLLFFKDPKMQMNSTTM
jgi:hypothetical protein